ncbi:hypothetical protein HGB07_00515, partial [Candidatus Roizmanbacteria bacterium]|nr:hypothetical protein [Candidatus Roizmanbacteria bacterium]
MGSRLLSRYGRLNLSKPVCSSETIIKIFIFTKLGLISLAQLASTQGGYGLWLQLTVFWGKRFTLFGEARNDSTHHKKEPHAMLMSFRKIKGNISIHHNLLFSSRDRHPTLGGYPPPRSDANSIF